MRGKQLEDIPIDCCQRVRTLSCSGPGVVTNYFADSDRCACLPCLTCKTVPGWLGFWNACLLSDGGEHILKQALAALFFAVLLRNHSGL